MVGEKGFMFNNLGGSTLSRISSFRRPGGLRKERAFHTFPTEWCAVCRTSSLRFPSPALANGNPQRARQKPIPTVTKSLHLAPPSRHSNPCSNLLDYVSDSHCSIYMQAHSLGRHDKDLEEPKSGSQCEVLKRETIEMIHSNI